MAGDSDDAPTGIAADAEAEREGVDSRTILVVTVLVLSASVGVAFGFNALSTNPLRPDADLVVRDAPDVYELNRSGTVGMVTVAHEGGETVALSSVRVVVGPRSSAFVFDREGNWSISVADVEFRLLHEGRPLRNDTATASLAPGQRLTIAKTDGRAPVVRPITERVRVFHRPSQTTLVDARVTVE